MPGERQSDIGGKVLAGVKEDREFETCNFAGLDIGLKVSNGLASGGDMRLAIGGSRSMLDGLWERMMFAVVMSKRVRW